MNKIVIFGQYRTGTSATFYKIKQSLPNSKIYSLFEPTAYQSPPDTTYDTILAKVILGTDTSINYKPFLSFDKKIYLVRDPRDWLISGLLFLLQQEESIYGNDSNVRYVIQCLQQKEVYPESISVLAMFKKFMQRANKDINQILNWIRQQQQWLVEFEQQFEQTLFLKYEDFVDGKVRLLANYLEIPITSDTVDINPIYDHVARTQSYGDWKNWFLSDDIDYFRPIFSAYLQHHNYEDNWILNDNPIILPQHSSEYAKRVIERRRRKNGLPNTQF